MAKPVLIVKCDGRMSHKNYDILKDKGFSEELKEEYHILLVIDDTIESSFEFQCLNVEDSDKINFKELQQHIDNSLKK